MAPAKQHPRVQLTQEAQTRDRMRAIAERPGHEVYEYAFDEPEVVLPAAEVERRVKGVRARALQLREADPGLGAAGIGEALKAERAAWAQLSRTHPRIFGACADPATSDAVLRNVYFMLWQRRRMEENLTTTDEANAAVMTKLLHECRREPTDEERVRLNLG